MQIDIDDMAWWACEDSFSDAMQELKDAILIATERESVSMRTLLIDVEKRFDTIGKLTGMNGIRRITLDKLKDGMPC